MLIEISYIVTRTEGRRTVKDKRHECVSVGSEYLNNGRVNGDGRYLILQFLELRAKLAGSGTISNLEVGLNPEVAREMREQRMQMECFEHLKSKNISSPQVKALETEYRRLHGLSHLDPLEFRAHWEIEMAFIVGRPFDPVTKAETKSS